MQLNEIDIDLQGLFLQAKAFTVKKADVVASENYSVEFVVLAGLKHLLGLKNYYETHSTVSNKALKAEIETLKAQLNMVRNGE